MGEIKLVYFDSKIHILRVELISGDENCFRLVRGNKPRTSWDELLHQISFNKKLKPVPPPSLEERQMLQRNEKEEVRAKAVPSKIAIRNIINVNDEDL